MRARPYLVMAVTLIIITVLGLSLVPMAWRKPRPAAYDMANASMMVKVGWLVKQSTTGVPEGRWCSENRHLRAQLAEMYERHHDGSKQPLLLYDEAIGPLRIVARTSCPDTYGMVWAVTCHGMTVKVFPGDITE